jgi:uncharacterized protein YciI
VRTHDTTLRTTSQKQNLILNGCNVARDKVDTRSNFAFADNAAHNVAHNAAHNVAHNVANNVHVASCVRNLYLTSSETTPCHPSFVFQQYYFTDMNTCAEHTY